MLQVARDSETKKTKQKKHTDETVIGIFKCEVQLWNMTAFTMCMEVICCGAIGVELTVR